NTARRLITRRINEHRLSVGISLALSAYSDTHFICHGNSDPLASKPTTPDTVYEIGSVSKVLTGLLLSLLSLEGLVSLDTPVRDVLPAGLIFPDTELATATLFDLASHYSGLPSVPPSILSALLQNPYRDFDVCAMKDYLKSSQTVTPPGTQFEYSNTGFTLLGIILEHITGEDWLC
ncbi:TPA: beta-lactamase family protein, partial [Klebsiella pneumoniae]|nr:beta-lactamase family protein [Klebsiella pneumoniae]